MKKILVLWFLFGLLNAAPLIEGDKTQFIAVNKIIKNPGFEMDKTGWTNSGGTFLRDVSNKAEGAAAASFDASASGQYFEQGSIALSDGMKKQNCVVTFKYKGGDTNLDLHVYDASSNLIVNKALSASTDWVNVTENFICPDSASVKIQIYANADSAQAFFDSFFLGEASKVNLSQVNQSEYYGGVSTLGASNCAWQTTSSGAYASFSADTDCNAATPSGYASAPATKIPAITFSKLSPGTYYFVAAGTFLGVTGGSATANCQFRFTDGTNNFGAGTAYSYSTSGVASASVITGTITYTSAQSSITIQMQAGEMNGAITPRCDIQSNVASLSKFEINVYRFPLTSETAFRPELTNQTAGVIWENVTNCSFTATGGVMTDSDCNTATRTYGSVTSGNDNLEMTVTNLKPGKYYVSTSGYFQAHFSSTALLCLFKITDGTTTISSGVAYAPTSNLSDSFISGFGGIVEYTSLQASKTFSVYATRVDGDGICQSSIGNPDRTVGISLIPIDQSFPMPNIVNSVSTSSAGKVKVVSAHITNSGTPTISRQDGSWISALADNGAGEAGITVATGTFSALPNCVISLSDLLDNHIRFCNVRVNSATSIDTFCRDNTTAADIGFDIICVGAN